MSDPQPGYDILGEVFEYDRNSNILSLERVYSGEPMQDAAGRTFTHLWYVPDRLGSVRTVVDDADTIRQCTM